MSRSYRDGCSCAMCSYTPARVKRADAATHADAPEVESAIVDRNDRGDDGFVCDERGCMLCDPTYGEEIDVRRVNEPLMVPLIDVARIT